MAMIRLDMTVHQIVVAMCQGNLGGLSVLCELIKHGGAIDPDDAFGGLGSVLALDDMEVYGSKIWMIFKDVCGEDIGKVIALLRADQLGQLAGVTRKKILHAIENRGEGIDVDVALKAVREWLPRFDPMARAK